MILVHEEDVPCCELKFWMFILVCVGLVILAGLTSGLALGMLSFSQVDLEVLIKSGSPRDRRNALRIQSIVKNQHLLLTTLLIGKSLALAAFPIFMDKILLIWISILVSVPILLAFTEVIPQAVCARHGLALGAVMSPFVQLLLLILFPISYPVSKLLDWLLGKEHSVLLRRSELKTYVDLHADRAGKGGELSLRETTIMTGAIDLTQKTAKEAMTPISQIFSLSINSRLDMPTMTSIMVEGHSRIPIYSEHPKNIVGLILVKNLIFCRPEDEIPVRSLNIRRIPRVYEDWSLYDVLTQFQQGHCHMAVVLKNIEDTENTATDTEGLQTINNQSSSGDLTRVAVNLEGYTSSFEHKEHLSISIDDSDLSSKDTIYFSPTLANVMDLDNDLSPQYTWQKQMDGSISREEIESFTFSEEVAIGIITVEDILEELLQEDIPDETDGYVHVRKNIKINLPPRR